MICFGCDGVDVGVCDEHRIAMLKLTTLPFKY